jgi:hypothetical protein
MINAHYCQSGAVLLLMINTQKKWELYGMTKSQKPFDQNLRDAVREIRGVLKKRNIGGYLILGSETHLEYAAMWDIPTWSVLIAETTPDGMVTRMKAKNTDPRWKPTINMLCGFRDAMHNSQNHADELIEIARQHHVFVSKNLKNEDPESAPTMPADDY